MAELKHVWLVRTPSLTSPKEFAEDPALQKRDGTLDEKQALAQFCDPDGHSVDTLASILIGMGGRGDAWAREKSKLYTDKASAMKDAEKRLRAFLRRAKQAGYSYDRRVAKKLVPLEKEDVGKLRQALRSAIGGSVSVRQVPSGARGTTIRMREGSKEDYQKALKVVKDLGFSTLVSPAEHKRRIEEYDWGFPPGGINVFQ